uniref:Reverse transcriptase Ty1/copia-type domain-containing protein n=1 Tax=Tanacetum cinerariifolium TaxID=118510 RepID=A0A699HTT5_TANCI|nr:hypothetical protein [Tanacetum cinerariifolium]
MALDDDETVTVGKESARNGEWVKISMIKVHTLHDMENNDERKYFLDFLCINLNYVEEQRNNIVLKHRDLVQELNTCKEQLLVLKLAKLDFLTMQHVNIEILKESKNLRKELKELTSITNIWLNSSNKVNQCISEQILSQKKRILGLVQLTEDPSSSGKTNLVFVKSLAEDIKAKESIIVSEPQVVSKPQGEYEMWRLRIEQYFQIQDYALWDVIENRNYFKPVAQTFKEPKRITNVLKDPTWVEAMQEELLQFHLQKIWTLVDFPRGKKAIGTKWVFRNKKDQIGIIIRNKARLVAQGFIQEEDFDYDKVFSLVARIKAIRLFLAFASFMGFLVYQMDVKSAFLYERIKEEVYVCQLPGFEDPDYPDKVYKVEKALYGKLTFFLGLQVKQKSNGIFISQNKYVDKILRKFKYADVKPASTLMDKEKALLKDSDSDDVYVHLYRFQVNPKVSHLHVVKKIFRYLKGQPKLGIRYPRDYPFDLVAYTDSDYAGASLDRKSTSRGC